MTTHPHSNGIVYFCNDKGCTEGKIMSAAHTEADYNELVQKVKTLEGVLATTQFRNSTLQAQVDQQNNNGEDGKFKDYKNLAECMKDNIADDPNHDPVTAKRRCEALAKNDLSKEGYKKSASVNSKEPPSWAVNMGLVEVDYEENEDNLKSASVENEGTLIGTMYHGKNRESNTVVRLV